MNRHELKLVLESRKIRKDSYSLTGGHQPERYELDERDGKWLVYYSERGIETNKKEFSSESVACTYLLKILIEDQSVQK
jgi:hypothetical protein